MEDRSEPPEGGTLELVVDVPPVSLQASRRKKNVIISAIREVIGETGFILSGEVEVDLEWLVHERLRYETLETPDIDNVLKVAIDALCGPAGVLLNDCQVQSIKCRWIDWTRTEQRVTIRIRFSPDDWLTKEGLRFVRVYGPLCLPLNSRIPDRLALATLEDIERRFASRNEIIEKTGDWYAGQQQMPLQQPFHVGRLSGFTIVSIADIRQQLASHGGV